MQWPALVAASRRGQPLPLDRTRVRTEGNIDLGLGVPDQDASQGWSSRWTGPVEINTNILPLGLTFVL